MAWRVASWLYASVHLQKKCGTLLVHTYLPTYMAMHVVPCTAWAGLGSDGRFPGCHMPWLEVPVLTVAACRGCRGCIRQWCPSRPPLAGLIQYVSVGAWSTHAMAGLQSHARVLP